jgi:DNA-directed RNA polymerase subunit RPC12/RpoP
MAEAILAPGQRAMVVDFAMRHGPTAAARRFRVPVGTVKTWQDRHRKRQARLNAWQQAARDATPVPEAAEADATVEVIAARMAAGQCLRCGGAGRVEVPAKRHGSLLIRRGRRIPCPDCGTRRIVQVVEHPRAEWTEAQRVAGDAGLGWSGDEWERIRAGDVNPDGMRFTGRGEG